jgi:hypothetical protein
VGTATHDPSRNYTNLVIPVGPNITNVLTVKCNGVYSPRGYEMYAVESDGGLNGGDDDFGRRFFYGGSLPFGAVVGSQQLYYSGGGTTSDGELSLNMTLSYK